MNIILAGLEVALDRVDEEHTLIQLVSKKAVTRAVNHAAAKTKTLASKKIREQVNLKAGYVRGKLRLTKARPGHDDRALINARKRGVLLTRYGARQTRHGVTVKVNPKGARKRLPHAFMIDLLGGNRGVAVRVFPDQDATEAARWRRKARNKGSIRNVTGRGRRVGRYPIKVLYGPSVDQVFRDVREDIAPQVREFLEEALVHELDREFPQ